MRLSAMGGTRETADGFNVYPTVPPLEDSACRIGPYSISISVTLLVAVSIFVLLIFFDISELLDGNIKQRAKYCC